MSQSYRSRNLLKLSMQADLTPQDLEATFDAYIIEATRLKTKYAGQIELLVGLETEAINPASFDGLERLLEKHEVHIDYIVGSVHHVNGIPIDFDRPTFDNALASFPAKDDLSQLHQLFCAYFDLQYEIMQRFEPEVIGHFDLCRLYLPSEKLAAAQVWQRVQRNVEYAVAYGALFELNAAAFRKKWPSAYPAPDVISLIKQHGGRFTLSDDSHGPLAVGLNYAKLQAYLVEQEIHEIWYWSTEYYNDELNDFESNCKSTDVRERRGGFRKRRRAVASRCPKEWMAAFAWTD